MLDIYHHATKISYVSILCSMQPSETECLPRTGPKMLKHSFSVLTSKVAGLFGLLINSHWASSRIGSSGRFFPISANPLNRVG